MTKQDHQLLTAVIVSEDETISLAELCSSCALSAEQVILMVDYGIIEPLQVTEKGLHWQFSAVCLPRLQTAIRLQRDLKVNMAGIAVALDLLDEVKSLRQLVLTLQRDLRS